MLFKIVILFLYLLNVIGTTSLQQHKTEMKIEADLTPFNYTCPNGKYITSLVYRTGHFIDQLSASCSDGYSQSPKYGGLNPHGSGPYIMASTAGFKSVYGFYYPYYGVQVWTGGQSILYTSQNKKLTVPGADCTQLKAVTGNQECTYYYSICPNDQVAVGIKGDNAYNKYPDDFWIVQYFFFCGDMIAQIPSLLPSISPLTLIPSAIPSSSPVTSMPSAVPSVSPTTFNTNLNNITSSTNDTAATNGFSQWRLVLGIVLAVFLCLIGLLSLYVLIGIFKRPTSFQGDAIATQIYEEASISDVTENNVLNITSTVVIIDDENNSIYCQQIPEVTTFRFKPERDQVDKADRIEKYSAIKI